MQPRLTAVLQVADGQSSNLRQPAARHRGDLDIEPEGAIDRIGGSDDGADLIVSQALQIAGGEALADAGEAVTPGIAIDDPRIAAGGEIEGGLRGLAQPHHRGRLHATGQEAVTPVRELARGQQSDRLGRQRRCQVLVDPTGIGDRCRRARSGRAHRCRSPP